MIVSKENMIKKIYEEMLDRPLRIFKWHGGKIFEEVVMLGDVLDRLEYQCNMQDWAYTIQVSQSGKVVDSWHEKRKPLEDQTDECIKFIYSLIP